MDGMFECRKGQGRGRWGERREGTEGRSRQLDKDPPLHPADASSVRFSVCCCVCCVMPALAGGRNRSDGTLLGCCNREADAGNANALPMFCQTETDLFYLVTHGGGEFAFPPSAPSLASLVAATRVTESAMDRRLVHREADVRNAKALFSPFAEAKRIFSIWQHGVVGLLRFSPRLLSWRRWLYGST